MNPTPAQRLADLRQAISRAAADNGRDATAITLVAVSKRQSAEAVRALAMAGQRDFGENYLQEALDKQQRLRDLDLDWHFIGPIQSNKTREIAAHFDWVHSVDRLKVAERLSDQRPATRGPMSICVQVNVSGEASKSGCDRDALPALCRAIEGLPHLRLRGLMAIPAPTRDGDDPRAPFALLREAFTQLVASGHDLDALSMGMSDDYPAAIAEGASHIRVGTALFGPRSPPL